MIPPLGQVTATEVPLRVADEATMRATYPVGTSRPSPAPITASPQTQTPVSGPTRAFPDPDEASPVRGAMNDLSDQELGRVIAIGSVVGVLGIFAIVIVMCLVAGTSLRQAAGIAIVPTIFGSWFSRRHLLAHPRRLRAGTESPRR